MLALLLTITACVPGGRVEVPAVSIDVAPVAVASIDDEVLDQATEAWRRGDALSSTSMWTSQLEDPATSDLERARLCHNLGNAAFRRQDPLEAVAWYTASLRLDGRRNETHANLEYARSECDLEPADDGSLGATFTRLLQWLGPSGTAWCALLGVVGLLVCLLGEALRGGFAWRVAALVAVCLQPLFWAPKVVELTSEQPSAWMVVSASGVRGYAEPGMDSNRVAAYVGGDVLLRHDAVGDHVLVSLPGERRAWVRADTLFDLDR